MLFENLLRRTFADAPGVRPRLASRFESDLSPAAFSEEVHEITARPRQSAATMVSPAAPPGGEPTAPNPASERIFVERQDRPLESLFAAVPLRPEAAHASTPPSSTPLSLEDVANPPAPIFIRETFAPYDLQQAAAPPLAHEVMREREVFSHTEHSIERRLESLVTERITERVTTVDRPDAPAAKVPAPAALNPVEPRASKTHPRAAMVPETRPARPEPREFRQPLPAVSAPAPDVHITIGRLEIRTPPGSPARPAAPSPGQRPNLADYLRKREGT